MLRVASAKVAPSAFRAIAAPRVFSLRITNAFVSTANPRPLLSHRNFSVQSKHRELVTALDSEIKTMQLMPLRPAAPADFPFQIQHNFYDTHITLSRDLDGEEIRIRVQDVDAGTENQNDDGSSSDGDSDSDNTSTDSDSNDESDSQSVTLKVEIFKGNGKSMKFVATASADEIEIERLSTKEGNTVICSSLYIKPYSELEFAFRDFLEMRGVQKSIVGFLYDYMVWKSKLPPSYRSKSVEAYSAGKIDEQNVETLKKLKQVIEEW